MPPMGSRRNRRIGRGGWATLNPVCPARAPEQLLVVLPLGHRILAQAPAYSYGAASLMRSTWESFVPPGGGPKHDLGRCRLRAACPRQPRRPIRKSRTRSPLGSLVRRGFLDQVNVADDHSPAAEPREARGVQGVL